MTLACLIVFTWRNDGDVLERCAEERGKPTGAVSGRSSPASLTGGNESLAASPHFSQAICCECVSAAMDGVRLRDFFLNV